MSAEECYQDGIVRLVAEVLKAIREEIKKALNTVEEGEE